MSAVAASIAVVTAVALAGSAALADAPGTVVASGRVVVPAASPTAAPQAPESPAAPSQVVAPAAQPEVVEAPAPTIVGNSGSGGASQTATGAASDGTGSDTPADLESAIAAAKAGGSWDALRQWAAEHGWSGDRIDALVSRLRDEWTSRGGQQGPSGSDGGEGFVGTVPSDPNRSKPTEQRHSGQKPNGHKQNIDRPAHAGSDAGHGEGAGPGSKRDQSRDSPDRRD
ncbi:hypothetical protein [Microbacterium timonense]|uniref:hypothetical protein n=1 Tax=Microbacterium timonense TaxID=2086576 RepID=UPI000D107C29|nr:hypothetical protein [Microbacterium timonense]